MHVSDFLIQHIQYVTVAPHPDRNSLDNLFRLLDGLDVLERDKMLAWMYLAFLAPAATEGSSETDEERLELRFGQFEQEFRRTGDRRVRTVPGPCGRDLYPGVPARVWGPGLPGRRHS